MPAMFLSIHVALAFWHGRMVVVIIVTLRKPNIDCCHWPI